MEKFIQLKTTKGTVVLLNPAFIESIQYRNPDPRVCTITTNHGSFFVGVIESQLDSNSLATYTAPKAPTDATEG